MFIDPSKFFNQENKVLFLDKTRSIYLEDFKSDILSYIIFFNTVESSSIILYIKSDIYLFYLSFLASIFSNKHVILPSFLGQDHSWLSSYSDTIVSNLDFSSTSTQNSSFNYINISKPSILDSFSDTKNFFIPTNYQGEFSFFTSGSTSTPKRIIKNISHICNEIENIYSTQRDQRSSSSIVIGTVEAYHIYGMLWRFFYPLRASIPSWLPTCTYKEDLEYLSNSYKDIIMITTPSFLEALVPQLSTSNTFTPSSFKSIYTSGSLLTNQVSTQTYNLFGLSPIEIYGSTETGGIAQRQQLHSSYWTKFPPVKISLNPDFLLKVSSSFINTPSFSFEMKDKVELLSDSTFNLLERDDRLVKIYEKRVSLPQMETYLNEHPFIKKSHIIKYSSNTLGSIITLSDEGIDYILKNDRSKLILKLREHLLGHWSSSLIPKKFKISFSLPYNPQGKLSSKSILSYLNSKIDEPIIKKLDLTQSSCNIELCFLKSSYYFKGHFPKFPILPGVVQLHFIYYFTKRLFNLTTTSSSCVKKLKFTNPILPDTLINLSITINTTASGTTVNFKYFNDTKTFSSGEIHL